MAGERLQQGMIVWVLATDPRGHRRRRPVVIVTSDQEIAAGARMVGVAVTTSFPEPPPPGYVNLPWDSSGRAGTQLQRRSAAGCGWLVSFHADDIDATAGMIPAATLLSILQWVRDTFCNRSGIQ